MTADLNEYAREADVFYQRQQADIATVIILSLGHFGERNKRVIVSLLLFSILAWIAIGYQLLHKDSYLRHLQEKELRRREREHLFSFKFAMGPFSNWSKIIEGPIIAVVVLATCNRANIKWPLDQLLELRPSAERFPIIVSLDCNDTAAVHDMFGIYGNQVTLIEYPQIIKDSRKDDLNDDPFTSDTRMAKHYGWALNKTFLYFNYQTAIVLEQNLEIAPDFFSYFESLLSVLQLDPTLYCVSAWNDNGKNNLIDEIDVYLFHRSDSFPRFTWMLTRHTWTFELMREWPAVFWDNWNTRQADKSKYRSCIRPEISRVKAIGISGSSRSRFSVAHLNDIHLNKFATNFSIVNLSYLLKDYYDILFVKQVYILPVVELSTIISRNHYFDPHQPVRVIYKNMNSFKKMANTFGIMDNAKSYIPPTAYRGIVTFKYHHRRIFLTPPLNWAGYYRYDNEKPR